MSLANTISSAKNDLMKPNKKSYWNYDLEVHLESVSEMQTKKIPLPTEKRALLHEFSGIEPVQEFVVLDNRKKSLGRLTTLQVKEIFNDMGFNVSPTFGGKHHSDFDAVMNIGGYSIPGWVKIARVFSSIFPTHEKMLLRKLAPGKDRLHLRFFESNDGSWLIAAHTDHNWLSLNLKKIYQSHVGFGAGDYITGTLMLYFLLTEFAKKVKENKVFLEKDIAKVLGQAYNQSLVRKIRLQKNSNIAFL